MQVIGCHLIDLQVMDCRISDGIKVGEQAKSGSPAKNDSPDWEQGYYVDFQRIGYEW